MLIQNKLSIKLIINYIYVKVKQAYSREIYIITKNTQQIIAKRCTLLWHPRIKGSLWLSIFYQLVFTDREHNYSIISLFV